MGSESDSLSSCPQGGTISGVDVSVYQGTIDFEQLGQSGLEFVITRMGDGLNVDTNFSQNWPAMQSAGLYRGAYHYFRASIDGVTQANLYLSTVGTLDVGDLPPALDMETLDGQTVDLTLSRMQDWLSTVEQATGRTPIIYSAPGFWAQLGNPDMSAYTLWVANWDVTCPGLPGGWSSWSLWQSSSTGTVPGISTAVDLDEFNGTQAQLDQLANMGQTPPPSVDGSPATSTDGGVAFGDGGTPINGIDGGTPASGVDGSAPSRPGTGSQGASGDIHLGCSMSTDGRGGLAGIAFILFALICVERRRVTALARRRP